MVYLKLPVPNSVGVYDCVMFNLDRAMSNLVLFTAVREDRMPGGRPKAKRAKVRRDEPGKDLPLSEPEVGTSQSTEIPTEFDWQSVLQPIVDARPDLVPITDGKLLIR